MTEPKFIIESGIQLLARLTKKSNITNFYSVLFRPGLKNGDIIEINYDANTSWLLIDMISNAIIPSQDDNSIEVLLFNTDGNINYHVLLNVLRNKISKKFSQCNEDFKQNILQDALSKLHLTDIFDGNQFIITIHNLDNILIQHSNVSLVVFNSLTAFYWSEQGFKITKMDLYVKNLLQHIQKLIKEYKIICVYTKPQYFTSNKDCDGHSNSSIILCQYHISLNYYNDNNEMYKADVKSKEEEYTRYFKISDGTVDWYVEE